MNLYWGARDKKPCPVGRKFHYPNKNIAKWKTTHTNENNINIPIFLLLL